MVSGQGLGLRSQDSGDNWTKNGWTVVPCWIQQTLSVLLYYVVELYENWIRAHQLFINLSNIRLNSNAIRIYEYTICSVYASFYLIRGFTWYDLSCSIKRTKRHRSLADPLIVFTRAPAKLICANAGMQPANSSTCLDSEDCNRFSLAYNGSNLEILRCLRCAKKITEQLESSWFIRIV